MAAAAETEELWRSPAMDAIGEGETLYSPEKAVRTASACGWRRAFPFTDSGEIALEPPFSIDLLRDPPEEVALYREAHRFRGAQVACGFVARGYGAVVDYSTWCPLTPPIEGVGSIYVGARHALRTGQLQLTWSLSGLYSTSSAKSTAEYVSTTYPAEALVGDLYPEGLAEGGTKIKGAHPDLAFLRVPEGQDKGNGWFFLPRAEVDSSEPLGAIAYNAAPDARSLALADGLDPLDPADRLRALDAKEQLSESAVVFHRRAVSPGPAGPSSARFLTYALTSLPGASGGAVVPLRSPRSLLAVHLGGCEDPACALSLGVRTAHPAFAAAYVQAVLPRLAAARLGADESGAVNRFLDFHWPLVRRHERVLRATVEAFRAAFPPTYSTQKQ
eukprot:m51a1_g6570 hypothetical protein (388) ;mRNA; r:180463-181837